MVLLTSCKGARFGNLMTADHACQCLSAGHAVFARGSAGRFLPPRSGRALQRPVITEEGMTALSKGDGRPLLAVDLACTALACSKAWAAKESAEAKPAIHLPLNCCMTRPVRRWHSICFGAGNNRKVRQLHSALTLQGTQT